MHILLITMLVTFTAVMGGCLLGYLINSENKYISMFTDVIIGVLLALICFDLIPEAIELTGTLNTIIGIASGLLISILIKFLTLKKIDSNKYIIKNKQGIIQSVLFLIGLAIHNFPEGIVIGSTSEISMSLGYSILIIMVLHYIPEGIIAGMTQKEAGNSLIKTIINVFLVTAIVVIGVIVGKLIYIPIEIVGIAIGIACGIMFYVFINEILEGHSENRGEKLSVSVNYFVIIGLVIGFIATLFTL